MDRRFRGAGECAVTVIALTLTLSRPTGEGIAAGRPLISRTGNAASATPR